MLLSQWQLRPFSAANCLFPSLSPFPFSNSINFASRPTNQYSLCSAHKTLIAQISEEPTTTARTAAASSAESPPEEGPIELPPSIPPIFATSDEPTPLQTATSVLLTGASPYFSSAPSAAAPIAPKRRSSGEKKSLAEEAAESLKAVSLSPVTAKSPPSPVQAFLGALTAGAIALILYKFTTTIESALNRQTISDNYSVRQITITIRTIINGLCYLATFVFGANALGLFLYSTQLAFNSFMEGSSSESEAPVSSAKSELGEMDSSETRASEDQSTDNSQ
ncbi:hypothetical protein Sango_1310600 [Sesamum angolense]|uniref:Uncharacterized protein n=1 Tax=Sesamum angolense TaxID=2727404 RepID=A0AAE1WRS8_9LAMI|nr:hypothetical protein Sango_1310600 [Sesamum angolense]